MAVEEFASVAVKAIIRQPGARYKWLLLKDHSPFYTLPGGCAEEGESRLEALKRELEEEICLTSPFTAEEVCRLPYKAKSNRKKSLWVVYRVDVAGPLGVKPGPGVRKLQFVNPQYFSASNAPTEQRIFACYKEVDL